MNDQHYDIYCAMNPIKPNAFGRHKCDILEVRHLYLDLDEDGDNALHNLLRRTDLPHPNFILNTSPHKYQTIWKVQQFTRDSAERLLRALARNTGSDIAATDIARVLRIPGLRNHKYSPPPLVTARYYHPTVLPPTAFPALGLASLPNPTPTRALRKRRAHQGIDHSRSGIDFGRTLGWLQRGVPHDLILQKLITQRPDKPNPEYYARKTLDNALRVYATMVREVSVRCGSEAGGSR